MNNIVEKAAKKIEVSIIVPTRNEEGNVIPLAMAIHDECIRQDLAYEIIFVDDHSTDKTQEYVEELQSYYPVRLFLKKGKRGKAYSLMEGFSHARYENLAMIDADLQYPPSALAEMVKMLKKYDVIVANRNKYQDTATRHVLSRGFKYVFGKMLFSLDTDIQAGLKVFKKKVFETVQFAPRSGWTFDLEFLHRAQMAGFSVGNFDITFRTRKSGQSKVKGFFASWEIGMNALRVRARRIHPQHMKPTEKDTMIGAGVGHKRRQYITHTTLPHHKSAIQTFVLKQRIFIGLILGIIAVGIFFIPLLTFQILLGILSTIYFIDTMFSLFIILKSLHVSQEINIPQKDLEKIDDSTLPIYSILCPLYKEAHIIPQFVEGISKIDWPKNKLDVMLLLEADDKDSITAARGMMLPSYVRIVVVPDSQPKTKPKACNYGLSRAKGEYLVIYDAEDIPDTDQLKKAYLGFAKTDRKTLCLQAKLNYYNPHHNILTLFFTAEYSLWFDVTLPGYQSINTALPLGGTSNHFRTRDLLRLEGWDPFNVTEDADLGMRLFKDGYKTAIINSTTLEEANSKWGNWIRQRSRWIKGYMQTYLVHTRSQKEFVKTRNVHALIFHLIMGGKISFILINPILWITTLSYFLLNPIVGETIRSLYPAPIYYMAVTSLVFGNFLYLFYYMIGCMKREQYALIKYVYLVPVYWVFLSIAGLMALNQLLFKPHYWEKTIHGLHLVGKNPIMGAPVVNKEPVDILPRPGFARSSWMTAIRSILSSIFVLLLFVFKK